ncbi:MAG: hypothetical protein GPJ54_07115 [Candidatus Heimdallarchaeota archaeon]|nr:hypothetical protein [Candidatus Heimdallarchaeota archaeon]
MKLHVFSAEIEFDNLRISLSEAFELLEKQSSQETVVDNFIGFTFDNNEQAVIQFVRINDQDWILDIPSFVNNVFQNAMSTSLAQQQVFSITRDFFQENSILHNAFSEQDFTKVINYLKKQYGLILQVETL